MQISFKLRTCKCIKGSSQPMGMQQFECVFTKVSSPLVKIDQNKMEIIILSIAVCTLMAGQVTCEGGNIYGSSQIQYSHPQPINYHFPQPHYGSQQSYNNPAGYQPSQQPQHHGTNQFSEQYLVTAIKTDPPQPVVHYQPPSYKPESPFNGQSYIIEPSYVLKPFRPETTYHAQAYRPHNPAPAVYQPAYHAPGYPSYPAPVYQPPTYQPQAYPAPAHQIAGQSSAFLVYSTPLLAGYSTQTAGTSGLVTNIEPSATQAYVTTASAVPESVSSSPVRQITNVEATAAQPVTWSDILSFDANELGQRYTTENGDQGTDKASGKNEELGSTTQESIPKSYNSELPKKAEEVVKNGSVKLNPPLYPIPANHTSKAVWKIPKTIGGYGKVPESSIESVHDVGDKRDGHNQANKKNKIDSNEAETEESSKSGLADKANKVGKQNKESSEITIVDQVTKISLQRELTKNEDRTPQGVAALSTSRETSEDKSEAAVVELVGQVSLQHEKPRSGSSVYYEQRQRIADQDINETKRNGESKESVRDRLVAEIGEHEKVQNGEINSEEVGTEATPVTSTSKGIEQVSARSKSSYLANANAEKQDVSIQVKETVGQKELSQFGQFAYAQGLVQRQEDQVDDSNETTEVSIIKVDSTVHPAVKIEFVNVAPIAAPVDDDESDEVPNVVSFGVPIQPAVSAYQIPYYPPRPIVPKLFRPKQESEEVEPPTAGFGDKIKVFTKFADAVQKVTQQGLNAADRVTETKQSESVGAENYGTEVTEKAVNTQPAIENAYATEGPTMHATLFYRKPVSPDNYGSAGDFTTPKTIASLPEEEELQTEVSYNTDPLFYAQVTEKFAASQLSRTSNDQSGTGQHVPLKKVDLVKEDVPIRSTEPNNGVRIVAEKISRDQPVQVVNAEPIVQMPVLAHDPMEKTDFYATQRIYTASAESPSDYITTSTPIIYAQDQNPYVTSTYAYIEEAGLSAEYQKEIAAAEKEATQSVSDIYLPSDEAQSQTESPDLSQEDVSLPAVVAVFTKASGVHVTKAVSVEDASSEVTSVPVTESAYQEKTESREVETVTSTAKPAEEVSSEIAYAAITPSTYQENKKAVSYEPELIISTKAQSAEDFSFEVSYPPVNELTNPQKTKIPFYETPVIATVKLQSTEDVSLEVVDPVTESNDQDEDTHFTDTPWTRYRIPVVSQEPVEAVTAPYDATQLFTTPDAGTTSVVVGTILQVDSVESQEAVTTSKTDDQQLTKTLSRIQNITSVAHAQPCHADKMYEVVHSPKFLFNTAALANVPLDSQESSDEDTATLPPTTGIPEVTTPSLASNESAERTTVASDGYKYVFKSRPTPNRFYESKTTTAIPSVNSTSTAQTTTRRPLVVIGKPIEIRKPINGRVYSRPSSMPQRKPQTLAQIKILPTRLRSSTSTIHLPNRRFFIGRSLMASEKGNRDSKEDDEGKAK